MSFKNWSTVALAHALAGLLLAGLLLAGLLLAGGELGCASRCAAQPPPALDVVVYGGTPSGIAAAMAAASDGCSVLLLEPSQRLGGMVTSGLSHTDFHSRESLSGAYADFAQRVVDYYADTYGPDSDQVNASFGGTFAEPKVNLQVFEQMLSEHPRLQVRRGERAIGVDVQADPAVATAQLTATGPVAESFPAGGLFVRGLTCVDAMGQTQVYACRVLIDATYEGDVMAMAGVPWTVGRESKQQYAESLAPDNADQQLQAYNLRFCMTRDPANRVAPTAPPGYRREDFVGVLDALQTGKIKKIFDYPSACIFKAQTPPLPNGKYDINDVSRNLVRLSLPGKNLGWPDGSPEERRLIFAEHLRDQVGLLFFLQNDAAVPVVFREEAQAWGWCRDEFIETEHLPPQLYVREARRMLGSHIYVQADSEHAPHDARAVLHVDSIAMADYGNNCHGTAHTGPRFGGQHTGEFYNPVPPYQIPYGVLVPLEHGNLLVSGAISSSHVGFCALRLEPVWMSLGQAAGHAAALAVELAQETQQPEAVQMIPVRALQQRLHAVGAATLYVSDVLPGTPDFEAVQWWGTQGGLHGLAPVPAQPGQRGKKLHGQYCEAIPGQAAELHKPLDEALTQRWLALGMIIGLSPDELPKVSASTTRGDYIRQVFAAAQRTGLTTARGNVPRCHPQALANIHPPGEVDNLELAAQVVSDQSSLPGIVVDDDQATLVGDWQYSTHTPPYVGRGYLHDLREGKGEKSVTFAPTLPQEGDYEVRLSHCYNVRRSTNTLVTIHHADGEYSIRINQQELPEHGGLFRSLGTFRFRAGRQGWVRISNADTDGKYVIADAVQFLAQ
jgi:hypothetical protein